MFKISLITAKLKMNFNIATLIITIYLTITTLSTSSKKCAQRGKRNPLAYISL